MSGRGKGFTLVEIMVAVAIIGLLASIAVPSFRRVQLNANAARAMNDLRVYSSAFQRYNLEFGDWPKAQVAGKLPNEMEGYINRDSFEARNTLRSYWKWEVYDHVVGIGVEPPAAALPILELVDKRFDDDSLLSGRLRIQSGSFPTESGGGGPGKGGKGPTLPDQASDTAHSVIAKIFAGKVPGASDGGSSSEGQAEGSGFIYIVDVNY